MQIVREMAGFSYGQADLFRRAISKKNVHKLEALKSSFIDGCLKNGKSKEIAERIYNLIFRFADYGFNKSHAYSYAVITCQMAYLKTYYPKEFYSSILDFLSPEDSKFSNTISELKSIGVDLSVADINKSSMDFVIDGPTLRLPLSAIKGLQSKFLCSIVDERNINGPYTDIFDFAARCKKYGLNLQVLVKLIDAGCFDSLCKSRESLRASAYSAMEYSELLFGTDGQQFLVDLGISKPMIEEAIDDQKINLEREYEATGIMVSSSPLSIYEEQLKRYKARPLSSLDETNVPLISAGIVKSIRSIKTKNGKKMAFVMLYDDVSEKEFVVFSEVYEKTYTILKKDVALLIRGHRDMNRENAYILDNAANLGGER